MKVSKRDRAGFNGNASDRQQHRGALMQQAAHPICNAMALLLACLCLVSACGPSVNEPRVTSERLRQATTLLEDTVRTEMVWAPDIASENGLSSYAGDNNQARLSDYSQAGFERARLLRLDLLNQLGRRPVLPPEHPLARDLAIATDAYLRLTETQAIGHGRLNLSQTTPFATDPFGGIWISGLDLLSNTHRVTNLEDAEAFVARVAALAGAVADTKRRLLADAESGVVAPRLLLEAQANQLSALLSEDSTTLNSIVSDLENLMLSVPSIDPLARERLLQEASLILDRDLRVAYQELAETLLVLAADAPAQPGLWAQTSERDLYRVFLRFQVAELPEDLASLHAQNADTAEAAREQFEQLLLPFLTASTEEAATNQESEQSIPPAINAAVIADLFGPDSEERSPLFAPSDLTQRAAPFEDLVSPFGVELKPRAVDGSRPNLLVINSSQVSKWPFWLADLFMSRTFHRPELDLADATLASAGRSPIRALIQSPTLRLGWVRDQHISSAADYSHSSLQAVVWQHWLLVDAVLAAADTGIHTQRWTEERAVSFVVDQALISNSLARDAVAYISAYPGVFTTKQIGARRIAFLRTRATAILSDNFSERAFGDVVLGDGDRPYPMLVSDIETWYESQLGAP